MIYVQIPDKKNMDQFVAGVVEDYALEMIETVMSENPETTNLDEIEHLTVVFLGGISALLHREIRRLCRLRRH